MMLTQQMSFLANDLATHCRVTGLSEEESKKTSSGHFQMAGCTSLENCENELGDKRRRLADCYFKGRSIGSGGFGSVYAGTCKRTGKGVAIKSISRKKVCGWSMVGNRLVPKEVALHHNLEQKYVIKLIDYFEEHDRFYIVMEKPDKYIDLFDYITKKGKVSERSSRYLFGQVLEAVQYCLSMGVLHRDVKDENILIDLNSYQIKLIDFGSGTFLKEEVYTEYEGTMAYSPPEWILDQSYNAVPATIWSLGILLYNMLLGDVPYQKKSDIAAAQLHFHIDISEDAESLIRWMLSFNPQDRPTMEQVLNHPWVQPSSRSSSSSTSPSSESSSSSSPSSSVSSRSSSSLSTADSCSPGGHSRSPNMRYNLRSSTTRPAAAASSRLAPCAQFSSSLSYSPRSVHHYAPPTQSPATSTTNFSCSGAFGRDPPGYYASRSEASLKSQTRPAYLQHGSSSAAPKSFGYQKEPQPHSSSKLWQAASTGEHDSVSFSATYNSQGKEKKPRYLYHPKQ